MRKIIQFISAILMNINIPGYLKNNIYKGDLKKICVPGMNCYSCPGAVASCPIGSLQSVIGDAKYKMSFYVLGTIALFGITMGRFLCGFLCPFGLFQELLHKFKTKKYSLPRLLKYIKYPVLIIFVFLLPAIIVDKYGNGAPYFCKLLCPVGSLQGGIFLASFSSTFRAMFGVLSLWKFTLLGLVILGSIYINRFFCKLLCPLGAMMAFFNKYSFYQYDVDKTKCISCDACTKICKMDVSIHKNTADLECIRCGECKPICPTQAITSGIKFKENLESQNI